jgi:5,10-methylenetetrahydromethanopterin reductase
MKFGCMFATSVATAEHIALAEELGYAQAFTYESPTIYADPWMALACAAERTSRIGLGVAVITPKMRHVTAAACALATLDALAPGRVTVVVGAGFTSQLMLGQKPARWSEVDAYVSQLRALLGGDELDLDGQIVGLFHAASTGVRLPVHVPVWLAANGPRGCALGQQIAELVLTSARAAPPVSGCRWGVTLHGAVLEDGESLESETVLASAGPSAAFMLHRGEQGPLAGTDEARAFAEYIATVPPERRHIETHREHLIGVRPGERQFVTADAIRRATATGTFDEVQARLQNLQAAGVDTVLYQPAGDIPRRLESFARAAALTRAH